MIYNMDRIMKKNILQKSRSFFWCLIFSSFVICCLTFAIPTSALADELMLVAPHGGGQTDLKSSDGAYQMWDIKAQPLAGEAISADGSRVQWGAIWWGEEAPSEVVPAVVEIGEGQVILSITRITPDQGGKYKVSWKLNTEKYPEIAGKNIDLYQLVPTIDTEKGATYSEDPKYWGINDSNVALDSPLFISDLKSNEYYFKGIITGIDPKDPKLGLSSAVAVGLIKTNIYGGKKYNLVSTPFLMVNEKNELTSTQIDVFSNDIEKDGIEVYKFLNKDQKYQLANYANGKWSQMFNIFPGEACWIYNPDKDIEAVLIGKVLNNNFLQTNLYKAFYAQNKITFYGNKKYNIFGSIYSNNDSLNNNTFKAKPGTEIYVFDNASQKYSAAFYDNSTKAWTKAIKLSVTAGMWFYDENNEAIEWKP